MQRALWMALLVGCVAPEQGIDRSVITGTVRIEAVHVNETGGVNNASTQAQSLAAVGVAILQVSGTLDGFAFGLDGTTPGSPDPDWYALKVEQAATVALDLDLAAAEGATVTLRLVDLDSASGGRPPTELDTTELSAPTASWELSLEPGKRYGLVVRGQQGEGAADYTMRLSAGSPDDLGVLVGAFTGATMAERGALVGGGAVGAFTLGEDLAWEGSYLLRGVREVVTESNTDGSSTTTVNEAVPTVYLFAGTWPNLDTLPAGTWYSGTPAEVRLGSGSMAAAPLVLDTIAPLVIGLEIDEVEPNDGVVNTDAFVLDVAGATPQDVGELSGDGFVDIFRGAITFTADAGFEANDGDIFQFTVPHPMTAFFNLDWDLDGSDLDVVIFDAEGTALDWAASSARPEVDGGYSELLPGETYYLGVLGYEGPVGGVATYELTLEELGI